MSEEIKETLSIRCLFEPIYGKYPDETLCSQYKECEGCPYADKGQV